MLGSDVACRLDRSTKYHEVASAYGGLGLNIGPDATEENMREVLITAQVRYRYHYYTLLHRFGISVFKKGAGTNSRTS